MNKTNKYCKLLLLLIRLSLFGVYMNHLQRSNVSVKKQRSNVSVKKQRSNVSRKNS